MRLGTLILFLPIICTLIYLPINQIRHGIAFVKNEEADLRTLRPMYYQHAKEDEIMIDEIPGDIEDLQRMKSYDVERLSEHRRHIEEEKAEGYKLPQRLVDERNRRIESLVLSIPKHDSLIREIEDLLVSQKRGKADRDNQLQMMQTNIDMWNWRIAFYSSVLGIGALLIAIVSLCFRNHISRVIFHPYPPSYCQSCGYLLTGNQSGICPECGNPTNGATDFSETTPA